MKTNVERAIEIRDVELDGHAQAIRLRTYHPPINRGSLPVVVFFHGGGFVKGAPEQADATCSQLAVAVRALVVSVGYSLAPRYPFPTALCDGLRAGKWVVANAQALSADVKRMAVAGHDAGGNLAAGLAAMARDQAEFRFSAQVLLAPLLDPSMTRIANLDVNVNPDVCAEECASGYRAYLPVVSNRLHPYAAPIESRRLKGLPAAFIASAENDLMHVEAEKYAAELIAAGVPTTAMRYENVAHNELVSRLEVIADVAAFLNKRFGATSVRA
ncbi:alpha/beta hydrolase [Paraburkholderia silviterrae]|uniref:Alpha/beta hydrolase n=1 Tax=Paraburkholderia silviterrae TaxID=2528715 RepID=A0A4R5M0X1_9BURK|nr:alpha/beta hydrolase [Paraburkholderia silviterrae]TDG18862.1 alpha/beta hydrolase [Paraburkholderia silviterrae]